MLSATPYNISAADIATQLRLFLDPDAPLPVRPETWLRETPAEYRAKVLTNTRPDTLKAFAHSTYAEDWRDLLRLFMVRRTRSFIKKHYAKFDETKQQHYLTFGNGKQSYFPHRLPKTAQFTVTEGDQYHTLYSEKVVEIIGGLQLPRYGLKSYVSRAAQLTPDEQRIVDDLGRAGVRLKGFARSSFFKRLESSGKVFLQSLQRHIMRNAMLLYAIDTKQPIPIGQFDAAEFDEVINDEDFLYGGMDEDVSVLLAESAERLYGIVRGANVRWLRTEIFTDRLRQSLVDDNNDLTSIINMVGLWQPQSDAKLNALQTLLTKTHANDKVLVFTQFADTAHYLVEQLKLRGVHAIAEVTGHSENPAKIADRFSPKARKKQGVVDELRIIIATDVLSEGQNLQDAHIVVNFDLPWAIIRLVQRAGRVDRIGQESPEIWCYSFLPTDGVESILKLRRRIVERLRMQGEILGGDEQFIEDLTDEHTVTDVFTEKSSIYEDKDNEVDMASYCYQIWTNAIQANRDLEKSIPRLPAQLRSAKVHEIAAHEPHGVLTFVKTKSGLSALRYVRDDGFIMSQSARAVIDLAACQIDTPRAELNHNHDAIVEQVLRQVTDEFRTQEVGIGPANSARYRTYERLKEYCLSLVGDMFRDHDLERVVERMITTPFTERATDTLNRLLRAKDTRVSELADRVMALHRDNLLFVHTNVDSDEDIASIVCSLGLVQGDAE